MNLLDFAATPLWLVWDASATRRRGRRRARRIGAHRAGPAGRVPGRRRPRRAPADDPSSAGSPPPPTTSRCATSRRCRRSSCGSRPPGPTGGPDRERAGRSGSSRAAGPTSRRPACSSSAPEVVTLAGGVRRGLRPGRRRAAVADGARRPGADAPVVACLGGPHRRGRAARRGGSRPRGRGLPARSVRADRRGRRDGHARPGRPAHAPAVRRLARGRMAARQRGAGYLEILAAGGGILSTVAATRAASTDALMAHGRRWLDEMLGHGVTTIEAKSGYGLDLETEIRLIEAAYQLGLEGPDRCRADVPRCARGPARVPDPAGWHRGVRPIDHRGPAPRGGRPRPGTVLPTSSARAGVFDADQSRRILEAAAGLRARAPAARRRARPIRWRRAGRRPRRGVGRPSRHAVAEAGIAALAAAADADETSRSSPRSCRSRPGS